MEQSELTYEWRSWPMWRRDDEDVALGDLLYELTYYVAEQIYTTQFLQEEIQNMADDTASVIEGVVADLKASEGRINTKLVALQHAIDAAGQVDPAVQAAVDDLRAEASSIASVVPDTTATNGSGAPSAAAPDVPAADGSTVTEPAGNVSTATPDPSVPIDTGATSTNEVTPVTTTGEITDDPTVTPTDTTEAPVDGAATPA